MNNEGRLEIESDGKKKSWGSGGIYISKSLAIIFLIFFFAVLLTVSLLIGLLGRRTNTEKITYYAGDEPLKPTVALETTRTTSTPATTTDQYGPGPWTNIRLPKEIKPHHYTIEIKNIDTDQGKYNGKTTMEFEITASIEYLLFHEKFLNITSVTLTNNVGEPVNILDRFRYVKKEYHVLKPATALVRGNYTLEVQYEGYTKLAIVGMYQSTYFEESQNKVMIATKFEPTDARRAFPCFDEPHLKATYTVIIWHALKTIALSNFPIKTEATNPDNKRTEFEQTFKMSTYLISWVVAPDDFAYNETKSAKGKTIRVYARKLAVQSGLLEYALEMTKKSLDFFENEYFKIPDAIPPKIDMIAIPDFTSGAMEHWGLVGFRETRLLFSEKDGSVVNKQSIAQTIAHEISHFWFGNYVTCAWWNDLWLNEAMARFLEYKAVSYLNPDWTMEEQYINEEILPVMWDDSFTGSHPVEANVTTPDEINNVFDSITYSKGSALLRMLEGVVGADKFQEGLQSYLKANAFGPGQATDFYNSLTLPPEMNGKTTPDDFMNTWLKQMNYPKVYVELENTNSGRTIVRFNQSRFLFNYYDHNAIIPANDTPYNYQWQIYLECRLGGIPNGDNLGGENRTLTFFLNKPQAEIQLEKLYGWIKCNNDFKSFYVTDYSDENFQSLTDILIRKPESFSLGDRSNLIHDAYQLAYVGAKSYEIAAEISNYLEENESSYVPWRVFMFHINKLSVVLQHRPIFKRLASFGKSISQNLIRNFNIWENTGAHLEKRLKSALIDFMCRYGDENCLNNATKQFQTIPPQYFDDPENNANPISPNIRLSVYRYHIQNSYFYDDWTDLFDAYRLSIDPQEKTNILNALSYSRLTWILTNYLNELTDKNSIIRKQDFFDVLIAVCRNPTGRSSAWYFYRHNWEFLKTKFTLQDRTFGRAIRFITESFENEFLNTELNIFYETYPDAGAGEKPRQQALDTVINNIFWIDTREENLKSYLFGATC